MGRRIRISGVRGWVLCLSVFLAGLPIYFLIPATTPANGIYFGVFMWAATLVMVGGLVRSRARRAGALWLLTGYAAMIAMGVTVILLSAAPSADGVENWFYLAGNCAGMAGAAWLIRIQNPGRDREGLLDAAIISSGFALLVAVFLIKPAIVAAGSFALAVVATSQPLADLFILVLLLTMAMRGSSLRNPAMRLIALGQSAILIVDCVLAFVPSALDNPLAMKAVTSGTLLMYTFFAAAALHPAFGEIVTVSQDIDPRPSRLRTPLLWIAVMAAPALLVFEAWQYQMKTPDAYPIAAGCAVIFGLVVARLQALVVRVNTQSRVLAEQADALRILATHDGLTGLTNRRAWDDALAEGLERARRHDLATTVAIMDLDHFKRYNDTFGHQAGDRLLKSAAAAWSSQIRAVDVLARYGGEEFIMLLPECGFTEAVDVLARMRDVTPDSQTFSAGIATWDAHETQDQFVARADAALYQAKRSGRARSVIADPGQAAELAPDYVQTPVGASLVE
jgi:diguanylate cyclase